jgi:hypothetical protein
MKQDITEYVKGCAECQQHKVNNRPTKALLQPIYPEPEALPFETVALDFIIKLPVSQGFDSILMVTDQGCTKASIFIPCTKDITAEETAALYIKHIFTHFGLPTKVISDRDPQFMSKFMQETCRVTGIKHAVTDQPVTRRKSITFDSKAKVGALVQRARTFKKQKLAEEAEEDAQKEQQALAHAVSTRQYAIVRCTGSVTGRMKTT